VEVGRTPLLRGYIVSSIATRACRPRRADVLRDDDSAAALWSAVCQATIAGAPVDWKMLLPQRGDSSSCRIIPGSASAIGHAISAESYQRLNRRKEHPPAGFRLHEAEWAWENQIDTQLYPGLRTT